jgi:hypothetical protein
MALNFTNLTGQVQNATQDIVNKGLNKVIPGNGVGSQIAKGFLGNQATRLINNALFPGAANNDFNPDFTNATFDGEKDIRARLALSPGLSGKFYRDPGNSLLAPLRATDGVIWPYTPSINVNYSANYTANHVTHANYASQSYAMSSVDSIQCAGTFTANTPQEAQYVLAVINFLRSATKMFYGVDSNRGTPPPVLRFSAHGPHMFHSVPVVLGSLNQDFEPGVDYIDARTGSGGNGINSTTRVPTSMLVTVQLIPVISRARMLEFGLDDYAAGRLIGSKSGPGTLP